MGVHSGLRGMRPFASSHVINLRKKRVKYCSQTGEMLLKKFVFTDLKKLKLLKNLKDS